MRKNDKSKQTAIVSELVNLHRECGSQTKTDLIRAGYSPEQIDICAPLAAQKIAELDRLAA
jgi:hypothetical protein